MEPKIRLGDELQIDKSQHTIFESDSAQELASKEHKKLMRLMQGLYEATEVQNHKVAIIEDVPLNKVASERLTAVQK